jgi:Icc-related predicted phosphoesterase
VVLILADVHGATEALRRVVRAGETLVVLGDLINFIDYRTNEGIVTDITGRAFVDEIVRMRTAGRFDDSRALWRRFVSGREQEVTDAFDRAVTAAYVEVCAGLEGATAYVTYGNVDRPDLLASMLPPGSRFVDGEVVDVDGFRIGIAGGGQMSLGTPGEVTEDAMAAKLDRMGPVDVLGTHLPPAIPALSTDVIGGRAKGSEAILEYLVRWRPRWHYFGDVHQPQASSWRVGPTRCVNVGYFRATGRAVRHPARI